MSAHTDKPLVSICITGRNDNYSRKFIQRMNLAINFLAKNAQVLKKLNKIEIILVDWNSTSPLANELALSPEAKKIVSTISVPRDIAEKINPEGLQFNSPIALNVALRRGRGKYIALMPSDILIPEYALSQLLKLLEEKIECPFDVKKSVMCISRKFIPNEFDDCGQIEKIEQYLVLNTPTLRCGDSSYSLCSGAGMLVFSSEVCNKSRGINEKLTGWGFSDIDFGLRLNMLYPNVNLQYYGIYVYDFEPDNKFRTVKKDRMNKFNNFSLEANDENWGLGNYDLPIVPVPRQTSCPAQKTEAAPAPEKDFNAILYAKANRKNARHYAYHQMKSIKPYQIAMLALANSMPCKNILGYGNIQDMSELILSRINPCANFFSIQPDAKGIFSTKEILKLDSYLFRIKHKGQTRYIHETKMLIDNGGNSLSQAPFDMIIINADEVTETGRKFLLECLKTKIRDDAAVIIYATVKAKLDELKNCALRYVASSLLSDKHNTCILINSEKPLRLDSVPAAKAWKVIKINKFALAMSYLSLFEFSIFKQLIYSSYKQIPYKLIKYSRIACSNIRQFIDF